jgi:hypothetical protein
MKGGECPGGQSSVPEVGGGESSHPEKQTVTPASNSKVKTSQDWVENPSMENRDDGTVVGCK